MIWGPRTVEGCLTLKVPSVKERHRYPQDLREGHLKSALGNLYRGNPKILRISSGLSLGGDAIRVRTKKGLTPLGAWVVVVRKGLEVRMEPRMKVRTLSSVLEGEIKSDAVVTSGLNDASTRVAVDYQRPR